MDGNSEGYFAYGFTLMKGVTCVNAAGDQLVIDVSELGDPDRAWGFFVTNRDQRSPVEAIGSARPGAAPPGHLREGPLLRRDRGEPGQGPPGGAAARSSTRCCRASRARRTCPEAVAWFPTEGLEPGLGAPRAGERPRPAPAEARLRRTVRGGRAFVVPEASAQAAAHARRSCARASRTRRRSPASATRPSPRRTSTWAASSSSARAHTWPASRTSRPARTRCRSRRRSRRGCPPSAPAASCRLRRTAPARGRAGARPGRPAGRLDRAARCSRRSARRAASAGSGWKCSRPSANWP